MREMLLPVSGAAMVGHNGRDAAARRDDDNGIPCCSAYTYADVYAPTSTSTSARPAAERWQQLR